MSYLISVIYYYYCLVMVCWVVTWLWSWDSGFFGSLYFKKNINMCWYASNSEIWISDEYMNRTQLSQLRKKDKERWRETNETNFCCNIVKSCYCRVPVWTVMQLVNARISISTHHWNLWCKQVVSISNMLVSSY